MKLERISSESAGISSEQVRHCIESLTHEQTEMHGFMAARYGKVFAECWWSPYCADLPHSNHSLGKSYTAAAIGVACTEGILRLDEKLAEIFPEEIARSGAEVTEYFHQLTVRDVLIMANGMPKHPVMTNDWMGDYFREPVLEPPGTRFRYNTSGTCMLGAVIQKKTGRKLFDYLKEKIFDKIGIDSRSFRWFCFQDGQNAAPGTLCRTEDNLRLAMLYMNGGEWNGKQLIDRGWIKEALSVQIGTDGDGGIPDCRSGYGYQIWACSRPGVFRFDGGQGQYAVMWPEKGLIAVVHEGALAPEGNQKTLDILYEKLFDCIADDPLPENPEAHARLKAWESGLSVEDKPANTLQIPPEAFSGFYEVTQAEDGADPWVMLAPGPVNHYRIFYDSTKEIPMSRFSLAVDSEKCMLVVNGTARFEAWLDGKSRIVSTENVLPGYDATCSTARYLDADTLEINIRWANSWFINRLTFHQHEDRTEITVEKDRKQQDGERWRRFHAQAQRKSKAPFPTAKEI